VLTNIRYILLCALKDRLFYGLLLLLLAIALLSGMLGGTSFIEEKEMSVVFTAAASRLMLVIASVVFVCFYVQSSFDNKHMDVMLSRPISRDQVVLSHWLGFALISVLMVIPVTLCLVYINPPNSDGLWLWSISMLWELWIVVGFALFASLILSSAVVSVLATLAFYVASRMMILFIMTAERVTASGKMPGVRQTIEGISTLMPRLDLFAHSEWLIYGMHEKYPFSLLMGQTCLFVSLLILLCIFDFRKKQF
jgi:ABC-type transport system involved in multi-copper enzyme maturation permease subunit